MGGVLIISILLGLVTPIVKDNTPLIVSKLYNQTLLPYLWMFVIAAFISDNKTKTIPYLKKYWWCLLVLVLLSKIFSIDMVVGKYNFINTLFLFLGLTGFAYSNPKLNIRTDISYGIYIYHMTIVNALIVLGITSHSWLYLLVAFMTCILAWLSTITVGRWSCNKKSNV